MINPEDSKIRESGKNPLLDKINEVLTSLESKLKYLKLPDDHPEYKSLKGNCLA